MNPQLMASGSDDSKVKIWSTKSSRSVLNIEAKVRQCALNEGLMGLMWVLCAKTCMCRPSHFLLAHT